MVSLFLVPAGKDVQNQVAYSGQVCRERWDWASRAMIVNPCLSAGAVAAALKQCGDNDNKVKAAKVLGVGRATLNRFLVSQEASLSHQEG